MTKSMTKSKLATNFAISLMSLCTGMALMHGLAWGESESLSRVLAQVLPWGVDRIHAPAVHLRGNKGAGVKVAVMATGIDYTHPDLDGNYKGGVDIYNSDSDPMDDNGLGTHLAGIIAAEDNSEGVIGVAPEAWLYAVKTLNSGGSGNHQQFANGIQWCIDNGIQVILYGSMGSDSDTKRLACQAAYDAGILIVAGSGNDGAVMGTSSYPARYDTCLAVGAVDTSDTHCSFSSFGPELDVVAPGVNILSTQIGGGYVAYQGTTMAAAHVAGVAALLIKSGVSGPSNLMQRMRETADDLGDLGLDDYYGHGIINADNAMPAPTPTLPLPDTPIPTPTAMLQPQAEIIMNGTPFSVGKQLVATFKVNELIEGLFDVYAVLIFPDGKTMLNARTLNTPVKPVARKVNGLPAGFTYQLLSKKIPPNAPKGKYELAVIFFDATKPYRGRSDAFLDVSTKFTIT